MNNESRINAAISELLKASIAVYGDDVVIQVGFDIVLKKSSRNDLTDSGIDDILDEGIDGNR